MANYRSTLLCKSTTGGNGHLEGFARDFFTNLGVHDVLYHDSLHAPGYQYYNAAAFGLIVSIYNVAKECAQYPDYIYKVIFDSGTWSPDCSFQNGWADVMARFLVLKGYDIIRADWDIENDKYKYFIYKNTYNCYPDDVDKWVTIEPIEPPPAPSAGESGC